MTLRFSPSRGAGALVLNSLGRGPTGAAATLTAGTATTLAAGSSATVGNSGSSSAAVFDIGIPRGADTGMRYAFESSTSMAAPASGGMRLNNATISSVTAIAVNATNSDGIDISDYVATWDDSTNSTKGRLEVRKEGSGSVLGIFTITSVVDNTTWLQINVTYRAGSGSFSLADSVYLTPYIAGDAGAIAGSLGSTDNLGVRADGTGGATLQAGLYVNDDSGNLYPATSDTGALGTTSKMWADLFVASGAVLNFNNGDITITHSTDDLAFAGGTFSFPNAGLRLADTNASHFLIIVPGSDLTANRNFTITTGDAARTLTISGDHTLPGGTSAILAGGQTLTGGFSATPFSAGTKSSGTFTPAPASGNLQYATNGGAHTLAPPATACSMVIEYTNNASAGAITTSGFTKVTGDTITTTNGHKFFFFVTVHQTYSHLCVQALQ